MNGIDWSWWLTIVGTVASIAGVVFSWMAWWQAKGAKTAAEEAAMNVRRRDRAYEVSQLARDAKDFVESIHSKREEVSVHVANRLMGALSAFRTRATESTAESRKISNCVKLLEGAAIRLKVDGIPAGGPSLESLLSTCHDIHQTACEIAGLLERRSED